MLSASIHALCVVRHFIEECTCVLPWNQIPGVWFRTALDLAQSFQSGLLLILENFRPYSMYLSNNTVWALWISSALEYFLCGYTCSYMPLFAVSDLNFNKPWNNNCNKYKNYFVKMKGVSRDGGTKKVHKQVVLENDIATR